MPVQIIVKEIGPPRKSNALASAVVELSFDNHALTIADLRVLRNRSGETWVALPSFAIPEGKSYHYENTVTADRSLLAQIQAAVLDAYEQQQAAPAQGDAR